MAPPGLSNQAPHRLAGNRKGPPIDLDDVASVLASLHFEVHENPATGYREYRYTKSLAEIIQSQTNLQTFQLAEHVENTAAHFSALFAQIHEDSSIAVPVRALLLSIAFAVLRNALYDEHYLVEGKNDATRFVDQLKRTGNLLAESGNADKDIFYKKLVYVIDEIMDQHTRDLKIFNKALQKLPKIIDAENNRRKLLQQRTQEMEEAKARLDAAHSRMRAAIAVRTYNKNIPKVTRNFIDKELEAVLFFHFNKNEEKRSEAFSHALRDLETLIDASLGKRVELKPLFDSLDADMALLGYAKGERLESLKLLLAEIKEQQRGGMPAAAAEPTTVAAPKVEVPAPPPSTPPQPQAFDPNATLVIPAYKPPAAVADPDEALQDDFDYLAADCRPNTVFRLALAADTEQQIVKLAAIMKSSGEYIFVSRQGIKQLVANRREVAERLRNGSLVIIENPQQFNQALEAIIKSTRPK